MQAIILAAGASKRMRSKTPKFLQPVLGQPLIGYVVQAALGGGASDITLVVSPGGKAAVSAALPENTKINYAVQEVPMGTGHAVKSALPQIKPDENVLVLLGDMPLVTSDFVREFVDFFVSNNCTGLIAAFKPKEIGDLGRVYADDDGIFTKIIESRDIKPDDEQIPYANTGVMMFKGAALIDALGKLTNDNSQGEYYFTDVPRIIRETDKNNNVRVFYSQEDESVFTGINTQVQLAEAVAHMRRRINNQHMLNGVRIIAPDTVFIDHAAEIAPDVVIYPGCIIEGASKIAEGAILSMNTHVIDSIIHQGVKLESSVLIEAEVGAGSTIGPFAYLRPGTKIGEKCRIGNFVEVKNSTIGNNTNAAHLAYIGDADVGSRVNYACGAITANYDGKKKHRTKIGDGAFVGSNVNLVAPVTVGEDSIVAAGSTITDDMPGHSLGIARSRQTTKENWTPK